MKKKGGNVFAASSNVLRKGCLLSFESFKKKV